VHWPTPGASTPPGRTGSCSGGRSPRSPGASRTRSAAQVVLRDGRLITKREALDEPGRLGAPAEVVEDVRVRRHGDHAPPTQGWTRRRPEPVSGYLGPAIDAVVASYAPAG
jgi:hypothetical protein